MARSKVENGCSDMIEKIYGNLIGKENYTNILSGYVKDYNYIFGGYYYRKGEANHREKDIVFKENALILIKNLIDLHKLLNGQRKVVANIITKKISQEDLRNKMNTLEKEVVIRYNESEWSLKHVMDLKNKIGDINFYEQTLEDVLEKDKKCLIISNKKRSSDSIHYLRMIERIEERASYQDGNFDDMAEKALYFLKMGEADFALELLKEIFDEEPNHSYALYVQAMVYIVKNQQDQRTAIYHQMEGHSYPISSEEEYHNEMFFQAIDRIDQWNRKLFHVLLKAYQYWPQRKNRFSEKYDYEDNDNRNHVIQNLLKVTITVFKQNDSLKEEYKGIIEKLCLEVWDSFAKNYSPFNLKNYIDILTIRELSGILYQETILEFWNVLQLDIKNATNEVKYLIKFKEVKQLLQQKDFFRHFINMVGEENIFEGLQFIETKAEYESIAEKLKARVKTYVNVLNEEYKIPDLLTLKFFEKELPSVEEQINKKIKCIKFIINVLIDLNKDYPKRVDNLLKNRSCYDTHKEVTYIEYYKLKFEYMYLRSTYDIAKLYLEQKKVNEAANLISDFFNKNPELFERLKGMYNFYLDEEHYDEGFFLLKDLANNDPILPNPYYSRNDFKECLETIYKQLEEDNLKLSILDILKKIDEYY